MPKTPKTEKVIYQKIFINYTLIQNINLLTGPFADKIFKIVNLQKNKIDILVGNIKTRIKKQEFLFNPV